MYDFEGIYDFERDFSPFEKDLVNVRTRGISKSNLFMEVACLAADTFFDFCVPNERKQKYSDASWEAKDAYLRVLVESAAKYLISYGEGVICDLDLELQELEIEEEELYNEEGEACLHYEYDYTNSFQTQRDYLKAVKESTLAKVAYFEIESNILTLDAEIEILSEHHNKAIENLLFDEIYNYLEQKEDWNYCLQERYNVYFIGQ